MRERRLQIEKQVFESKLNMYFRLFVKKIKFIKLHDIYSVFLFLLALPISLVYRLFRKDLWLVCERKSEARDNGYVFFKYLRSEHQQQDLVYAIKKNASDYKKIAALGKTIEYGSLNHWILYLTAKWNISSQKDGKPNGALCYFLEVFGFRKSRMIFLRHGVTINDQKWIYYPVSKFRIIICGAYPEYKYISETFGYPEKNVKYLGLCRFDELHDVETDIKQILVIPTRREWITFRTKEAKRVEPADEFTNTEFFIKWNTFLNSIELNNLLKSGDYKLIFYPHNNIQKYIDEFYSTIDNVILANSNDYDIQELLKRSALMITDYSSVFIDFAYMKKPMIFYQFDKQKFREGHYQEGYFSYEKDGFGPVCQNINELILEMKVILDNNQRMNTEYLKRLNNFFILHDKKNSERTYEMLKNLEL